MSESNTKESLSEFSSAVDKLESSGSNWVMWQQRFTIAVQQKDVMGQFDGSNKKPEGKEETDEIKKWKKKEILAKYLLTQKLPDSIFSKYMRKSTVAEMWSGIVAEFTEKSMMMKSRLHSEFMALRSEKGENLRTEFDRVRMKYEELLAVGVEVSANDYRSLIIQFVPRDIAGFLAQVSSNFKLMASKIKSTDTRLSEVEDPWSLTPEQLMNEACEEWERREEDRKNRPKGKEKTPQPAETSGAAMATIASSERPGATAGGGRGFRGGRGRGRRRGGCWNCGGRRHHHDNCPSPKKDDKDGAGGGSSQKNDNKTGGYSQPSSSGSTQQYNRTNPSGTSQRPAANPAIDGGMP